MASENTGPRFASDLCNFTPRAQQVLALARKEADRFNHNFVGTEHLLLGLISLGHGVAVSVLQKMGVDLETARLEVENQVGKGPDQKLVNHIPYTPRVKKVLAIAAKEAKALNHTYVGTEHFLLGLLREGDGVAARVLVELGVDIEKTRQEILRELDPNFQVPFPDAEPSSASAAPAQAKPETPPNAPSPTPPGEAIDTAQRYDVYCSERNQEVVVYRNALFKGTKSLFRKNYWDPVSQFIQLEQGDGQTVFLALSSVIKFCEHGITPSPEIVSGTKP